MSAASSFGPGPAALAVTRLLSVSRHDWLLLLSGVPRVGVCDVQLWTEPVDVAASHARSEESTDGKRLLCLQRSVRSDMTSAVDCAWNIGSQSILKFSLSFFLSLSLLA